MDLSEKQFAIEKDNELLLGRLVEISRKKKVSLTYFFRKSL